MSTTQDVSGNEEKSLTKKVDIVCYLNAEDGETRRQFAQRVGSDRDYFEKRHYTSEKERFFIEAKDEEIGISEDQFEKLDGFGFGNARLVHEIEEEEKTRFKNKPKRPLTDELKDIFDGIRESWDEELEGWNTNHFSVKMREDDGDGSMHARTSFERMRMLKHQSEIEPDSMYVDDDEDYLAFKVTVKIRNVDEETMEFFNENLLNPMMTELGRHDWIDRVRTYDCEMKTEEKGVCFNI